MRLRSHKGVGATDDTWYMAGLSQYVNTNSWAAELSDNSTKNFKNISNLKFSSDSVTSNLEGLTKEAWDEYAAGKLRLLEEGPGEIPENTHAWG